MAAEERPAAAAAADDSTPRLDVTPKLHTPAEWPWKELPEHQRAPASDSPKAPAGVQSAATEGAGEPPNELTLQEHMWDKFDLVWQQRVEPSQRLLEQVMEVLRSRAELERKYGESLLGFGANVELQAEDSSVHAALDSMIVNFRNRGEQSLGLSEEIEQEIVTTFEEVVKQHREVMRRVYADVQVLQKHCQERKAAHDKLARRYGSRCADAEATANECLQGVAMKGDARMKLGQKALTLSKQARVAEHEYYVSIEQLNRAQALHDDHMPKVLATLQDLEDKRGRCLKDMLMKLEVYETSWLRNLQYDLEAVVKAAESADAAVDLQQFVRQNRSEDRPKRDSPFIYSAKSYFDCPKSKDKAEKDAAKQSPVNKPQEDTQLIVRQLLAELLPQFKGVFVEEGLPAGAAEEAAARLDKLRPGMADPRRRAAVTQVLRREVLARSEPGAELETAKPVAATPHGFEAVAALFKAALDACDEQNDAWSGRDLMVLAQLIRSEGDSGKPVLLLSKVYNHALWNKVTFWEEVLLVGLCEAHSAEAVWRRNLPAGSQFSQPAMTAFLQRFVGHMLAFGISFDQGRNSVWATLRKHQALLGTSTKTYGSLLLDAYEAAAARPALEAVEKRVLEESASPAPAAEEQPVADAETGDAPAATAPSASAAAAPEDDDFEAMAFGLGEASPAAAQSTPALAEAAVPELQAASGGEDSADEDDLLGPGLAADGGEEAAGAESPGLAAANGGEEAQGGEAAPGSPGPSQLASLSEGQPKAGDVFA